MHTLPEQEAMKALFLLLALSLLSITATSLPFTTKLGVTYSPPANSPPPDRISAAISCLHLEALRLPNPEPNIIRTFAYTNTSLFLSIPNTLLRPLASNRSLALKWLYAHVLPFYPRAKISVISVGNDAVSELAPFLLPAIRNVHLALRDLGIKKISVSTTFSFVNIITTAFPPSSAMFQEPLGQYIMKPLLQYLDQTNSSFLVNLYPYNMYRINSEIPIGFALFQEHPFNFRDDLVTGVRYRNLFDMMVDAVITSLAVAGHEGVPVVVAETGWPSSGGEPGEVDATAGYAEMYLKGLIGHLRSGLGTPLRKEGVAEVYLYELMDREGKQGVKHWGILHSNMSRKYSLDFSGAGTFSNGVFLKAFCLVLVLLLLS